MDYLQRINKYDSMLDVIFIRTKNRINVDILLTEFNAEFPEK